MYWIHCYDNKEFIKKFNNAKFIVAYSSLSSNMFNLNSEKAEYELFTKTCSLSANILKK